MTIADLKKAHPMPWTWAMTGNIAALRDAAGQEVPMFLMLDFVCSITAKMAAPAAPVQPA